MLTEWKVNFNNIFSVNIKRLKEIKRGFRMFGLMYINEYLEKGFIINYHSNNIKWW